MIQRTMTPPGRKVLAKKFAVSQRMSENNAMVGSSTRVSSEYSPHKSIGSRFPAGRPGSIGRGAGFFEKCSNFRFECREIISDNIPDNLPVYFEITMDHLVPHAGNLPPFNIGMPPFKRSGKIFDGFSDYFNCPYHCVCIIFVV